MLPEDKVGIIIVFAGADGGVGGGRDFEFEGHGDGGDLFGFQDGDVGRGDFHVAEAAGFAFAFGPDPLVEKGFDQNLGAGSDAIFKLKQGEGGFVFRAFFILDGITDEPFAFFTQLGGFRLQHGIGAGCPCREDEEGGEAYSGVTDVEGV